MIALALAFLAVQAQGPDSLTLEAALERARTHRASPQEAAALVAEARGAYRVAGTIPNPALAASLTEDPPQRHILVSQSLDWLLRRGAERAAGAAGLDRARADSLRIMAELENEVRAAFYGALGARQALAYAGEASAAADSLTRIADARLDAGDISQFDRDQVALEAARAHQAHSTALQQAQIAEALLARLTGWPGAAPPIPAGSLAAGLDVLPDTALPALEDIPAVRMAAADSAASASLWRSARIAQIPIPEIEAGADWKDPTNPGAGTLGVIGVTIPIPLWNHGGGAAAQARGRALADAARATETRLETERRMAEFRIRLLETARRARMVRDTLLPAAQRLLAQAVEAYRLGESDLPQVLDAIRSERQVAQDAVDNFIAFQEALAAWTTLTGPTQ